jgi:hypothetical protein
MFSLFAINLSYGQIDSTRGKEIHVDQFGYVIRTTDTLTLVDLGASGQIGDFRKIKFSKIAHYVDFNSKNKIELVPQALGKTKPKKGVSNANYQAVVQAIQVGENSKRLILFQHASLKPYLEATKPSKELYDLSRRQNRISNGLFFTAPVMIFVPFISGHPFSFDNKSGTGEYVGVGVCLGVGLAIAVTGFIHKIKSGKTLVKSAVAYNKAIGEEGVLIVEPKMKSELLVLEKQDLLMKVQDTYKTASGGTMNVGMPRYYYSYNILGFKAGGKGNLKKMTPSALKPYLTKHKASKRLYNKASRNKTLKYVGIGLIAGGAVALVASAKTSAYGFLGLTTGIITVQCTPVQKHLFNGVYKYNQAVVGNDISYQIPFQRNKLEKLKPSFYGLGYDNYNSMMGNNIVPTLKLGWNL